LPILNPFVMFPGYAEALALLERLRRPVFTPLFDAWLDIIVEDNRVGVLAGLDKDGIPLEEVRYRKGLAQKARFRTGKAMGTRVGRFKGFAPGRLTAKFDTILANNNLSTSAYKKLAGPPLAPRGEQSRVIRNLVKRTPRKEGGAWIVACGWVDVVDPKGKPFLMKHFEGRGNLAKRDLRGVRLQGQDLAVKALGHFVQDLISRS
jgi:hypothetical protein